MFLSRIFTLYPEYFPGYLNKGIVWKGDERKNLEFRNSKYKRLFI